MSRYVDVSALKKAFAAENGTMMPLRLPTSQLWRPTWSGLQHRPASVSARVGCCGQNTSIDRALGGPRRFLTFGLVLALLAHTTRSSRAVEGQAL